MEQNTRLPAQMRQDRCNCLRGDLHLAERFSLAVAVIDMRANILKASPAAHDVIESHQALLSSKQRIGLLSPGPSRAFRIAIRQVLSTGGQHMIRADDGCMSAPLGLHLAPWHCANHCLVSFHPFAAQPADFSLLADVFDLTARQLDLLEHFSRGFSLAEIADRTSLKPQTVREAFSHLYTKFEVRSQLELMSVLAAIGTLGPPS